MDRNSITGLVLMVLLTLVYFYFFAPKPVPPRPTTNTENVSTVSPDSLILGESVETTPEVAEVVNDSQRVASLRDRYSDLHKLVAGEEKVVTVTTDELTINISTKGGHIQSAFLNGYKTFDSLPLPIQANDPRNEFYFPFAYEGRAVRSDELFFEPSEAGFTLTGEETKTLTLRASIDEGRYIEQVYHFKGNTYDFGYEINFEGIRESLGRESSFTIFWKSYLPKTELSILNLRQKSTIAYRTGTDVDKLSYSDDPESEKLSALVKWISFKSQFFSHILIADQTFRSGNISMTTPENDESLNRVMEAKLVVDIDKSNSNKNKFSIYMGPNEYYTLRSYDLDLEDEMDLGWSFIGWINKGTVYVFKFLENYISNYGVIIIVLAILIRLLMFPLSHRSFMSMAKMRVLNGTQEMKDLDVKHKDDPQKLQMAKMGIYKEMGVSMFGGCLPMLLSYPFLIALFFFFPQSVELRQQSFLWAHDLSTYDSIFSWDAQIPLISSVYGNHISLFTILMAISTFVYTIYQQRSQPATAANAQMKYIAYFMPFFLLIFLNRYSSGLSLYYLMSNILQIAQTSIIGLFQSDEKLLAQMYQNRDALKAKKGKGGKEAKPKSRLEKWVEGAQKKQQEALKQRQQEQGPNRRSRRQK
ncbi:MAG: membrane protein insertase YidC [Bacteroidia bacterium]|nr:membrane protein insertase YidC [Bacteroidia bacterium]